MESKPQASAQHVYEDYEPFFEWRKEQGSETLVLQLPGFHKYQLRAQVTSSGKLRVSGEQQIGENKWRRFLKEIPIPSNCDVNGITANFENGTLYVKHPEKITLVETQDQKEKSQSSTEATKPKPKEEPQRGEKVSSSQQQQAAAAQEVASKASKDKQQSNGKGVAGDTNKDKELSAGKSGTASDAKTTVKESAPVKDKSGGLGEPEKKEEGKQRPTQNCYKRGVGAVGGWVTAVKGRSKHLSWVFSAFLVLILALYIKKFIIKTPGESASQEF